jgi:hypothetical protein
VQRIARKHSIGVRLASRPAPHTGTVAMVTLPPHLLCEIPADEANRTPVPPARAAVREPAGRPSIVPHLARRGAVQPEPDRGDGQGTDGPDGPGGPAELPRRERASLRGDEPRPKSAEPAVTRTPEQQAAARRAFAEELSAFTLGAAIAANSAGDTAIEEEAQQ